MADLFGEYMQFLQDYNVLGLALGFVIANNLGMVTKSFIDDVLMPFIDPFIAWITGATGTDDKKKMTLFGAEINVGSFISSLIKFLVVSAVIFIFLNKIGLNISKPVSWVRVVNTADFR